ncbi:Metalloendopeptidase-like protein [Ignavibacterium album JCM 16511]|uniref:Metalloendopeptidase-like protein n=1 Tax=Ignavibacterium album (strain DSM 19864 / JCM 16511 / NBRC 101810 / Mat9-16) TaxID=945713 RepID=I0AJX0_IGNAJ|nr:M23 family metallopeptidase [Ignavibacterium album]AFH49277.1 Metalloendopeptidase-like protein [Ignavibacterium album JCM 16511]
MKKFFYYSNKNLKFVEIKNFKAKTITFVIVSSIILSSLLFGTYYLVFTIFNSKDKAQLEQENILLKEKIKNLSVQYSSLKDELQNLVELSSNLRQLTNLKPLITQENPGIGGSIFSDEISSILSKDADVASSLGLIETLTQKFELEKKEYLRITEKLNENSAFYDALPAIIPTTGGYSIEGFGMRMHPILKVMKMHEGLDILTDVGSPVFAPGNGKIVYVGPRGGYGLTVEVEHGFGYKTVFAHLSKALVKEGQTVKRGDRIALTGNSGLSTGPHLHYEVHLNGIPQDPINYFFEDFNYFEAKKITKRVGDK